MGKMSVQLIMFRPTWTVGLFILFLTVTATATRSLHSDPSVGKGEDSSPTSKDEGAWRQHSTLAGEESREAFVEELCEGVEEEECVIRRTLAAHTDYIYTQHHNP